MLVLLLAAIPATAMPAPVHFTLDPDHTYPSFEADHMGLSVWRGKFDHSTGTATLDTAAGTGTVDVTVDIASIDFGNPALDKVMLGAKAPMCQTECGTFFVEKYPTARYRGTLADFVDGVPTRLIGTLTMRGVTRPLTLAIDRFKCVPDFMLKPRLRCGADALGTFERDAFGLDGGKSFGMDMKVTLRIQVEAVQDK
ncbi:YceI family protein [Rhodanobacter sp. DHB23]|uniref:YceI family protein n=1 Tax=Rhodanobacter sp. DHB23 TaxID=2775923 RepID=UPI001CE04E2E|nr:YceI family protein [Rhodanobacter sp. DHB23]